jgi:hypothetical protein
MMMFAVVHESGRWHFVFHRGARNFDAIGGTADIDWPPAPIASEAYDPAHGQPSLLCSQRRP